MKLVVSLHLKASQGAVRYGPVGEPAAKACVVFGSVCCS